MDQPPTISDLPSPPPGTRGWPWTVAHGPSPAIRGDEADLPRITVVTPSFNQGRYLEQTLRSVLLQGYENLEYIVMDGGSQDDSAGILRRYSPWITYWESTPDRGQTHAINKGWERSSGDLLAWLNSDDLYGPSALRSVAVAYARRPGTLIAGAVEDFDDESGESSPAIAPAALTWDRFVRVWQSAPAWHQPGLFFPRAGWEAAGPLDESYYLCMDRDFLVRILRHVQVTYLSDTLAHFRRHEQAKTTRSTYEHMLDEKTRIVAKYEHLLDGPEDLDGRCRFWVHRSSSHLLARRPLRAVKCLGRALRLGGSRTARVLGRHVRRGDR